MAPGKAARQDDWSGRAALAVRLDFRVTIGFRTLRTQMITNA